MADTMLEGEPISATSATVTRDGDLTADLTIAIANADRAQIYAPSRVLIPAGSASATFDLEVVNDGEVDGSRVVSLTASADGFTGGTDEITVWDDDVPDHRTVGGRIIGSLPSNSYVVTSNIVIETGQTLTIDPSSILRFEAGCGLNVTGTIIAAGNPNSQIIFTSAGATPRPGDWAGIRIATEGSSAASQLDRVEVAYATVGVTLAPAFHVDTLFTLSHSDVHHNSQRGVLIDADAGVGIGEQVRIQENTVHHNAAEGITLVAYTSGTSGSSNFPTVSSNQIFNNGGAGIALYASADPFFYSIPSRKWASAGGEISYNRIFGNAEGVVALSTRVDSEQNATYVGPIITSNLIVLNAGDGIRIAAASQRAAIGGKIINNTVASNGGTGISHDPRITSDSSAPTDVIVNNLVTGNGVGIASSESHIPTEPAVANNDVVSNSSGNWVNYPAAFGLLNGTNVNGSPADEYNNTAIDPQFVAPGDFHVSLTSPTVGAGRLLDSPPALDVDGDERVLPADIGGDQVPRLVTTVARPTITEKAGASATTAVVRRTTADRSLPVTVTLTNPDPTEVALPGEVVIAAGAANVTFSLDALDDSMLDGLQSVRLVASARGHGPSAAEVWVVDEGIPAAVAGAVPARCFEGAEVMDKSVASSADSLVVAWVGRRFDESEYLVLARRMGYDGRPIGEEIVVGTTKPNANYLVAINVSSNSAGGFAVSWSDGSIHDPDYVTSAVYLRMYSADDVALTDAVRVDSGGAHGTAASMAMGTDGEVIVSWACRDWSSWARVFDAGGAPDGGPFQAPGICSIAAGAPGQFVFVWSASGVEYEDIVGQVYERNGQGWGRPFRVNSDTTLEDLNPKVAADAHGNFAVVWHKTFDYPNGDIYARWFSRSGTPMGEDVHVNSSYSGYSYGSSLAIAMDSLGNAVVSWEGGTSSNFLGQQFHAGGFPSGDEFQINGTPVMTEHSGFVAVRKEGFRQISTQPYAVTPTLTSIAELRIGSEDSSFVISYEQLASAADEADLFGRPIAFRIESILAGILTKNGIAIVPGVTTVSAGESLVWTPPLDASGSLGAFGVSAWNGASASLSVTARVGGLVQTATLSGIVYNDKNGDGKRQSGELGLAGRVVFLDADLDGLLDADEPQRTTSASGQYQFPGLLPGSYRLGIVPAAGWRPSSPFATRAILAGQALTGDVPWTQTVQVSGRVFLDANGNGKQDSNEKGMAKVRLFIDADNDGVWDKTELSVLSNTLGDYVLRGVVAGKRILRAVLPMGYRVTAPKAGYVDLTLKAGQALAGRNISLRRR